MKEYIEREAAIRELLNDAPEQVFYSREDAADCIRYITAADVAPVRRGRWINNNIYDAAFFICDQCCAMCDNKTNYCPHCGCKMDKEDCND